jgi:hypothetical protein
MVYNIMNMSLSMNSNVRLIIPKICDAFAAALLHSCFHFKSDVIQIPRSFSSSTNLMICLLDQGQENNYTETLIQQPCAYIYPRLVSIASPKSIVGVYRCHFEDPGNQYKF